MGQPPAGSCSADITPNIRCILNYCNLGAPRTTDSRTTRFVNRACRSTEGGTVPGAWFNMELVQPAIGSGTMVPNQVTVSMIQLTRTAPRAYSCTRPYPPTAVNRGTVLYKALVGDPRGRRARAGRRTSRE